MPQEWKALSQQNTPRHQQQPQSRVPPLSKYANFSDFIRHLESSNHWVKCSWQVFPILCALQTQRCAGEFQLSCVEDSIKNRMSPLPDVTLLQPSRIARQAVYELTPGRFSLFPPSFMDDDSKYDVVKIINSSCQFRTLWMPGKCLRHPHH